MRGVAAQNSAWWEMHRLDAELLGGMDPWVGFTGMAFGLGRGVVCASPPPTCIPPASKTCCFISAGMGPTPHLMLHIAIERGGDTKRTGKLGGKSAF